nr:hypothetical protein [uncultured bacterium]AMP48596.1 hypothetical protein [uncultured bacterium]
MAAAVAFAAQCSGRLADRKRCLSPCLAVERHDRRFVVAGERWTTLTCRDLASTLAVGHYGYWNQWRAANGAVFARVESVSTKCVCGFRDQLPGCRFVCTDAPSATWRSACKSANGNSFPRFSARRRIPAQAVGLK